MLFKLIKRHSVEKIASHLGVEPIDDDLPEWIEVLAIQNNSEGNQYICNTERGMMLIDATELWQNMDYYKKANS